MPRERPRKIAKRQTNKQKNQKQNYSLNIRAEYCDAEKSYKLEEEQLIYPTGIVDLSHCPSMVWSWVWSPVTFGFEEY